MEEEYRTSSNLYHCVNNVESIISSAPPTIQCRYDLGIHDFGSAMGNFSIGLVQDLIVHRLIRNFSIRIIRSGYATYKDKQHHGISAGLLERKLGIGLYKSNINFQFTT